MAEFDVEAIISAYAQGYFLMDDHGDLGWYSSRRRALIPLDQQFRYPKSLQRILNQGRFQVAIDQDFMAVVNGCSDRPSTWISEPLKEVYQALHQAGYAHSFETWQGDQLAGGVLGIVIGSAFIGESMFYAIPDASKVAMVKLVEHLRRLQFVLFDAQMNNPHLERFGAYTVSDRDYQELLKLALTQPPQQEFWQLS
jgi:leucyl/phenylalanyl-tRNA--protein transferase